MADRQPSGRTAQIPVLHAICDLIEDGAWTPAPGPGTAVVFAGISGPPLLLGTPWFTAPAEIIDRSAHLLLERLPASEPGSVVEAEGVEGMRLPGGRSDRAILRLRTRPGPAATCVRAALETVPARIEVGHLDSGEVWSPSRGRVDISIFGLLGWLVEVGPVPTGAWRWHEGDAVWVRLVEDDAGRRNLVTLRPSSDPYGGTTDGARGRLLGRD